MSFVQERVHTGCHMIPEKKLFETSHFWVSLLGFSLQNKTLILDGLFYLYNKNAVVRKWVRMLVSYSLGVKISDLVPFTMSQTLVDHQRPSWYVLRFFSLNKIIEISITRTILMIWLKHVDKGTFIFGIFHFFVFELAIFSGRNHFLPLPHG